MVNKNINLVYSTSTGLQLAVEGVGLVIIWHTPSYIHATMQKSVGDQIVKSLILRQLINFYCSIAYSSSSTHTVAKLYYIIIEINNS